MPTYWGEYGKGSINDPAAARPVHRGAAAGFVCGSIGRNAAGESVKGPGPRGRALPQEAKRGGPGSDQRAPERPGQEGRVPPRPRSGVGQIRQERGEARAGRGRGGARSQTRALNHLQGNRLGSPAGPSRCVCCCVCGMRVPKPLQERARRVLTSEDRGVVFFSFATCFDTQGSGGPLPTRSCHGPWSYGLLAPSL